MRCSVVGVAWWPDGEAADPGATVLRMVELDEVVARLSQIVEELLELPPDDFARRFALEKERDELRAAAEVFHQRKDEGRSTEDLIAELAARRKQIRSMGDQLVNRAAQSSATGAGPAADVATSMGGSLNQAMGEGMGMGSAAVRVAELEQELSRRSVDHSEIGDR